MILGTIAALLPSIALLKREKAAEAPKPVPEAWSLDSLIDWLEKQPQDKTYCYLDERNCLLAQYGRAMGDKYIVSPAGLRPLESLSGREICERAAASSYAPFGGGRTFAAVLKTAKSYRRRLADEQR